MGERKKKNGREASAATWDQRGKREEDKCLGTIEEPRRGKISLKSRVLGEGGGENQRRKQIRKRGCVRERYAWIRSGGEFD